MPAFATVTMMAAVIFLQPDLAALRGIFEEGLAKRRAEYGVFDTRTAQAARDLGLFLSRNGQTADARNVLDQVVRIDEKLFGAKAPRTLVDVAELAAVSPSSEAESLWKRASETTDASVSARGFGELGKLRVIANDRAGAAGFYRKALAKDEEAGGKSSAAVAVDL